MTWICTIPGASAATSAWHLALTVGLAAFVVGIGGGFLAIALYAYRRPPAPLPASSGDGSDERVQ